MAQEIYTPGREFQRNLYVQIVERFVPFDGADFFPGNDWIDTRHIKDGKVAVVAQKRLGAGELDEVHVIWGTNDLEEMIHEHLTISTAENTPVSGDTSIKAPFMRFHVHATLAQLPGVFDADPVVDNTLITYTPSAGEVLSEYFRVGDTLVLPSGYSPDEARFTISALTDTTITTQEVITQAFNNKKGQGTGIYYALACRLGA